MGTSVHAGHSESILLLRLVHPSGYPRLTRAVLGELAHHFETAQADPALLGVVVTGTAQVFAAGADIEEVSTLDSLEATRFSALGQGLMNRIENLRKPVVAAIRGYCLGGGFDLALACHLRIASTDAVFAHPGGSLGILTGWGGSARLPRIVGPARARELLLTGRAISAEEALAWHLVSRVVGPEAVIAEAARLCQAAGARLAAP